MRTKVRAIVSAIDPNDALEQKHRTDALIWIDSDVEIFRRAKPATPPKHLVAYSLLVDRERTRALLIDHRLSGLWLPTGGHVEAGEAPDVAAERELTEELGVVGNFAIDGSRSPFFITVTETVADTASGTVANTGATGPDDRHVDVSLWYAFESTGGEIVLDGREARSSQWWPFDEIRHSAETRFDPHLPRAISKLRPLLDNG